MLDDVESSEQFVTAEEVQLLTDIVEPKLNLPEQSIEISVGTKLEPVGGGGQADVFSCSLEIDGTIRMVAVKSYRDRCSVVELTMLRRLQHPNIIKFVFLSIFTFYNGVTNWDGRFGLVLEFCESSLRDGLSDYPFNKTTFCSLASEMAAGLKYLHENDIIHRDVKPENVLIDRNGSAKLCDFGISRELPDYSTNLTIVGTSAYMAPELISNKKCSESIDVWSFGIVLWEMVTGTFPYQGMECALVAPLVVEKKILLPVPETSSIESILILIKGCLSYDPEYRFSMARVATGLLDVTEELEEMSEEAWIQECTCWREKVERNGFWRSDLVSDGSPPVQTVVREVTRELSRTELYKETAEQARDDVMELFDKGVEFAKDKGVEFAKEKILDKGVDFAREHCRKGWAKVTDFFGK